MKHLLPFLAGFVTFFVISGAYYMGYMGLPEGPCFSSEPDMALGLVANALFVALTAYVIQTCGEFSAARGAKHGAIVALTANGFLNLCLACSVPLDCTFCIVVPRRSVLVIGFCHAVAS